MLTALLISSIWVLGSYIFMKMWMHNDKNADMCIIQTGLILAIFLSWFAVLFYAIVQSFEEEQKRQ